MKVLLGFLIPLYINKWHNHSSKCSVIRKVMIQIMHMLITDFANICTFTHIVGHFVRIYDDLENNIITNIGPRKYFIRSSWPFWREGKPYIFVMGIWKESGMSGKASFRKLIPGVE